LVLVVQEGVQVGLQEVGVGVQMLVVQEGSG
jgi:hypothetical protein